MTNEEIIYSFGKGVKIQVWDDGTVYAELMGLEDINTQDRTLRGALEKLYQAINQIKEL
jgi:pyoverdine/dityrosine biosynthesis protein Dit1